MKRPDIPVNPTEVSSSTRPDSMGQEKIETVLIFSIVLFCPPSSNG